MHAPRISRFTIVHARTPRRRATFPRARRRQDWIFFLFLHRGVCTGPTSGHSRGPFRISRESRDLRSKSKSTQLEMMIIFATCLPFKKELNSSRARTRRAAPHAEVHPARTRFPRRRCPKMRSRHLVDRRRLSSAARDSYFFVFATVLHVELVIAKRLRQLEQLVARRSARIKGIRSPAFFARASSKRESSSQLLESRLRKQTDER